MVLRRRTYSRFTPFLRGVIFGMSLVGMSLDELMGIVAQFSLQERSSPDNINLTETRVWTIAPLMSHIHPTHVASHRKLLIGIIAREDWSIAPVEQKGNTCNRREWVCIYIYIVVL